MAGWACSQVEISCEIKRATEGEIDRIVGAVGLEGAKHVCAERRIDDARGVHAIDTSGMDDIDPAIGAEFEIANRAEGRWQIAEEVGIDRAVRQDADKASGCGDHADCGE